MKRRSITAVLAAGALGFLLAGFAAITPVDTILAQEDAPVTVESARPGTEIINEKSAYLATVSPDGSYIAWGKQSGRGKDRVLLCYQHFFQGFTVFSRVSQPVQNRIFFVPFHSAHATDPRPFCQPG